ncbi:hypothetical protein BH11CYA1_BH11CYA1_28280 [soil metagenome]
MGITKNEFFLRLVAMIFIGAASSLVGVISSSWWAGGLFGLLFGLVYTMFSQRILANMVFGKVGSDMLAWYGVHSVLGAIGYVAMLYLFSFVFSIHATGGWLFYTIAGGAYALLCERSLRKFFMLLPLWLATRR